MERSKVYELINGERDYQDSQGPRPKTDAETSVAEWLNYIQYQVNKSNDAVYFLDDKTALEHIRKIAALCVACMEYNNTSPRSLPNETQ